MFWRIWAPLAALNFNCAPLLASEIARTRITSPRADWVYAFARTSHAAASASTIGAVPGAACASWLLIWFAACISVSAMASMAIALFIAACAAASLISIRSRVCGDAFCGTGTDW